MSLEEIDKKLLLVLLNQSKILQEVEKLRKYYNQLHLDMIVPQSQQVVVPPTLEAIVPPSEEVVVAPGPEDVVTQGPEDVRGPCLSNIEGLSASSPTHVIFVDPQTITYNELRVECKKHNLSAKGTKVAMIQRLKDERVKVRI